MYFLLLILFYPILYDDAELILHNFSHVDTLQGVRVIHDAIIFTWGFGHI